MKLSLAWIFDHIDAVSMHGDVAHLIERLNETTAEIESWYRIELDTAHLTLARTVEVDENGVDVHVPEYNIDIRLPFRADVRAGHHCFLRIEDNAYTWARMNDFGSTKDALLPLVYADTSINSSTWRSMIEVTDYVLEVDNKSITHRPDLWSHRGFAREIAALLGYSLKPLEELLTPMEVQVFTGTASPASSTMPVITIQEPHSCYRLASSLIETISWSPSRIPMLSRLCRIDSKPNDALVDVTNYVMFDIGQPMHAFDAQKVRDHQLIVRKAYGAERIKLLDDQIIELNSSDVIVADTKQPLALAGIMGGADSAVTPETRSLLLEAGCFNPSDIRHSSARHKKRTDASVRFEKTLDAAQTVYALQRFMFLLHEYHISYIAEHNIVVVGPQAHSVSLKINHTFIEKKLGAVLESAFIIDVLESLAFQVKCLETGGGIHYEIDVPTWRSTKDIRNKEDIVEEIGRFFGYKNIKSKPLAAERQPVDTAELYRKRYIKDVLSLSLQMRELYSYAFFDESWLHDIGWQPTDTLEALQPVSANWRRLVTTLAPTHMKAIADNREHHAKLRFFEWARVWHKNQVIVESSVLAGIFFDAEGKEDFYDYKALIETLLQECSITVRWKRVERELAPWFLAHQTADIIAEDKVIGTLGMLNEEWRAKIAPTGTIGVFELNAAYLQSYNVPVKTYKAGSRFPDIHRDISMLVPLTVIADDVRTAIARAHEQIIAVDLIDFFQKEDWTDKKSLTFSYIIRSMHATMTTQEVDAIGQLVNQAVRAYGADIR